MGTLAVLDRTKGDAKIDWDPESLEETQQARATFDELRKKGYLAYKTDERGKRGEQMHFFDPAAKRVVLTPPLVGG